MQNNLQFSFEAKFYCLIKRTNLELCLYTNRTDHSKLKQITWDRESKVFRGTFGVMGIRAGHNTGQFWAPHGFVLVVSTSGSGRDCLWKQMIAGAWWGGTVANHCIPVRLV